jgi:DNA-binding transcriptional regulator YiaG
MKKQRRRVEWNGQSIKALRQHMGLTQDGMASELGTRQQTISEWERGLYQPRGASATLLTVVAERSRFPYQAEPQQEAQGTSKK